MKLLRGGSGRRSKPPRAMKNCGPGKNAQHKSGGHHSQKAKGNKPTSGSRGKW